MSMMSVDVYSCADATHFDLIANQWDSRCSFVSGSTVVDELRLLLLINEPLLRLRGAIGSEHKLARKSDEVQRC